MHTLPEGKNLKTFFKENYAIVLDSSYLFTKKNAEHEFEHDTDKAYGVFIH